MSQHEHEHQNEHQNKALSLAFWLNLIFSIIELIGGTLTNSTAIMTDALHDFTDAIAIGLAVWLEKLSGKPATEKFTFGFSRFSLLSALGMSIFLLVGALMMIVNAFQSFINTEAVHSFGMLGLAILGIIVNGSAFLNIKNGQHHHCSNSHGHKQDNPNSKAIMLHLLEDLLSWIAVLVGAVIINFTHWYWIDGLLAILIAVYIGYNAIRNLHSTLKILLMATPNDINIAELRKVILATQHVQSIDSLKVWSLDGVRNMATLNVTLDENTSIVSKETQKVIADRFRHVGVEDATIQFMHC